MGLLQRKSPVAETTFTVLERIRVRLRNPNSYLLTRRNILNCKGIVKGEMACLLCRYNPGKREHQQRQQKRWFPYHEQLPLLVTEVVR